MSSSVNAAAAAVNAANNYQTEKKTSVPKLLKQIFSALKIYPSEKSVREKTNEEQSSEFDKSSSSTTTDSPTGLLNNLGKNFLFSLRVFYAAEGRGACVCVCVINIKTGDFFFF